MKTNFTSVDCTRRHHLSRWSLALAVVSLVLFVLTGCGKDAEDNADKDRNGMFGSKATGERARYGNLKRDPFTVQAVDLNQDERPDQWTVKDAVKTRWIERDLNFDGRVDLWQYPDPAGTIVEEEMDLDLDGHVDVVVYYQAGVVTRKELSIDFAGKFSIAKYYDKQGNLLRVERDDDGDGLVDVWEYYENQRRVRIGWDENDDGQPDNFDTLQ